MKKVLSLALALIMVLTVFSACGTDESSAGSYEPADAETSMSMEFPFAADNDAPAIEGGTLKVGLVGTGPFKGILSYVFVEGDDDMQILQWSEEGIVSFDENFVMDQDGPCTYTYDMDAKTITLTLHPDIKWHDGEPVTMDDLVFAYEVICHPDYTGPRWDERMENVVGALEYHSGNADSISGLVLSEDKMELTIHFQNFTPTLLVGGFWTYAAPRHYLGGIPVNEMANHEKVRTNPIGFGPFIIKTIVPGEAVEFVRFDDYWRGTPKLDGVSISVINANLVPMAMENGELDVCVLNAQLYPDYKNPVNFQYVGELETTFNFTAFDLGDFDQEKETCVGDPAKKMTNLNLRKAIGYAVDNAALGRDLWNGLRVLATTIITPRHEGYQNKDMAGYYYNPDLSRQLLDEAGYIDVDGDGYREDPDGNQLTIYWGMMEGTGADTVAQFKIQCWADVGLRVELYLGRLHDYNVYYDYLQYDQEGLDMFDGAWGTGFDPNPFSLWGDHDWNYPHITYPELTAAMEDCVSEESWDDEFRTNAYWKWQELFFDYAPAIPTLWRTEIRAVNNRVKNYDMSSPDIDMRLHLLELTAPAPYKK